MRLFIAILFSLLTLVAHAECKQKTVILIPGFFNFPGFSSQQRSIKYFSANIIETLQKMGFYTVVFENLDPLGTVEINSKKVEQNILALMKSFPLCEFTVIGHSAGGLYLAQALTHNDQLPIKMVVTVSTPYQGAEIVDLAGAVPGWETVASFLNLQSLAEFSPKKMKQLLSSIVVPERVRWAVIAAEQESCFLLSCTKAQSLSWVLTLAWDFFGKPGDGVVSVDSALLLDGSLMNDNNEPKKIERWRELKLPLEHWEIVLEPGLFKTIGVKNTDWLRSEQARSFRSIAERL